VTLFLENYFFFIVYEYVLHNLLDFLETKINMKILMDNNDSYNVTVIARHQYGFLICIDFNALQTLYKGICH